MNIDMKKYRPLPFYFLNSADPDGDYSVAKIDAAMERLQKDGFGGCILFNLPPWGFPIEKYATPEFFEVTERFILAAQKRDMVIWATDGWRCPSGDVGGLIEKRAPGLKPQRLRRKPDGQAEVVDVAWGFPAFEEPESSRLFIELVYEPYFKYLGKYFGKGFQGFFSDADNRRFDAFSAPLMEGFYYPWSPNFAAYFKKQYGYSIEAHTADIVNDRHTPATSDYYRCCEELYTQWFRNNYNWCREHGLKYTFHTSDTGPFTRNECRRSSIFIEGNPFNFYRYADFPGTDHEVRALDGGTHFDFIRRLQVSRISLDSPVEGLLRTTEFADTKHDLRAKYVGSAAYVYGKEGGMCELFAATDWGVTPTELRQIAAWQLLQGANMLVPHAIAHISGGPVRYGAPPLQHYATGGSIREISDFIAKYCFISSQGKFAPSCLVEDISSRIMAGLQESEFFFDFTNRLNHAGVSYAIVPENTPGALRLEPGNLPALPHGDFTFTGGELLGMRRELADGEKFLLVCNLWSDDELAGVLTFEGRQVELALAPGEIAVIGSPWESFRAPVRYARKEALNFPAPVSFAERNRVVFHYNSEFTVESACTAAFLVPEYIGDGELVLDGTALTGGKAVHDFDDVYREYPAQLAPGVHRFVIDRWRNLPEDLGKPVSFTGNEGRDVVDCKFYLPVYLCGDFSVEITVDKPFDHKIFAEYNLEFHAPKSRQVTLKAPKTNLDSGSWAKQGYPGYTGSVVYRFDIAGHTGRAVLQTPKAAVRVRATVDGVVAGETGMEPYRIDLGNLSGKKVLEIAVTNTYANRLEEYPALSGLVGGAELLLEK